jgi:membrane protein YdbS with pleckstrin-like domain
MGGAMRIGAALIVIWLVIGVIAAAQRSYFTGSRPSCAKLGTVAVTIVAGPLNYVGVNPKVRCTVPQPSE